MHRILGRICEGKANASDLALLERLAKTIKSAAVCGMGGMAPRRSNDDTRNVFVMNSDRTSATSVARPAFVKMASMKNNVWR